MHTSKTKQGIRLLLSISRQVFPSRKAGLIMRDSFLARQTPSLQMCPSPPSFPSASVADHDAMCYGTWHSMYLGIWGQLFWLWPFPASHAPSASSLAGQHQKLKSPWLCVGTALQQWKQWCVSNIISILNWNHQPIPATMNKINCPSQNQNTILEANFGMSDKYMPRI